MTYSNTIYSTNVANFDALAHTNDAHSDGQGKTPDERGISNKLATVGVLGNIALSAFKLVAGIFGNSTAMISDAFHSLSDVFATAIAWVGVRISAKDADSSHPYGHERFECLASMVLGIILVATAFGIGWSSINSIACGAYLNAEPPTLLALIAALVGIASKEAMFWYTRHWAQIMNSSAFMADAWHHRSDAISCVGALLGILGSMAGYPICDAIASIAICVIILKVAYDVLREAVDKVTDTPCSPEFEDAVRARIMNTAGVKSIDSLHTRQFGNKAYVDAEIAVDGSLSLVDAHAIAEEVHATVEAAFPNVKHIMIHENPYAS